MEIQKPKLQDVTACLKKELACLEPLLTRREGLRFTLSAHSALSENLNRTQLLKSLENENWRVKHEVLTRWAWCRAQHDAIAQGQSFNRPFRCEVGSHEQRQTLDREFWCLLRFLPHYAQATCRFPLFLEYRGNTHSSPDFDLEVEGGRLGLEITEADGGRSGDFRLAERVEEGLCKLSRARHTI